MTNKEIRERLFLLQDETYRDFQAKLIPAQDGKPTSMIGVRTPALRSFAKDLCKAGGYETFLSTLPHEYFDENQLHAFIISGQKDFAICMSLLESFLPYIDNWATCDQLSPKVFKKHRADLLPHIDSWIASGKTFTIRFAIGMLLQHFLDEDFAPIFLGKVSSVRSEEYYVKMMVAWYFATALTKQYDAALPYIAERRLDAWTHNKAIQKSVESYRIPDERKNYLRSLRISRQ